MLKRLFYVSLIVVLGFLSYKTYFTFKKISHPAYRATVQEAVERSLGKPQGTYAIVVKNLKTNETYRYNEHKIFEPGSLYKIWILATALGQIQNGTLTEDEILSKNIQDINNTFDIDDENAELTNGSITLSVKNAIHQMIVISHNYASLLLAERVKLSNVTAFLKKYGLNESAVGKPPKTTAYDIALFFEKLYDGKLANKENTEKMLALFKKQTLNNKMPKYLPKETVIAHKTGEIGYYTHDAGIVFTPKGAYIIVVLSESEYPPGAEEKIAIVSKAVYDYFTNK